MASTCEPIMDLCRSSTTTLDPVGCCLALEGRLSSAEGREALTGALRQASQSGELGANRPGAEQAPAAAGAAAAGAAAPRCLSAHRQQLAPELLSAFANQSSSSSTADLPGDGDALPQQETLTAPIATGGHNTGSHHSSSSSSSGHHSSSSGSTPQRQTSMCIAAAIERTSTATLDANGGVDHGAGVNDPSCTCPPYAVKSTCGKRPNMEDTYALCPNICELPLSPMSHEYADKLPHRIAVQFESHCMYLPAPEGGADDSSNPTQQQGRLPGSSAGNGAGLQAAAAHQQQQEHHQQHHQQPPSPRHAPGQQQHHHHQQHHHQRDKQQHQQQPAPPQQQQQQQQDDTAAAFAGAASLPPTPLVAAPPVAESSVRSVSSGSDGSCIEKLHFFGVYDGHGGIEASQHCAQRLHYHLSRAVAGMASLLLEGSGGDEAAGAWNPEVKYVPLETARVGEASSEVPSGDCSLAAAAATAAQAAAGAAPPPGTDAAATSAAAAAGAGGAPGSSPGSSCSSQGASSSSSMGASCAAASDPDLGRSVSNTSTGASGGTGDSDADSADDSASNGSSDGPAPSFCGLMEEVLREAFLKTDEEFSNSGLQAGLVGSTAVVALVGSHRVWIANCGDSRAVLSRGGRAVQVTDDHKPEREDEAERVEKAGGQVLYWNGHRVMGVLAMSRAIGDHCLRPYVIPEPEISVFARHARDELLLLASDGLWDVLSNQEATDLALRSIKRAREKGASRKAAARVAATVLTKAAVDRGSRDNITVVIIDLSPPSAGGTKAAAGEGGAKAGSGSQAAAGNAPLSPQSAARRQQQQAAAAGDAFAAAAGGGGGGSRAEAAGAGPRPAGDPCSGGGGGGSTKSSSRPGSGRSASAGVSNPFAAAAASPFSTAATGSSELPLPSGASGSEALPPTAAAAAAAAAAIAAERSSRTSSSSNAAASSGRLRSSAAGGSSASANSSSVFAAAASSGGASGLPFSPAAGSAASRAEVTALADELDSIDLSGAGAAAARLRGGGLPSIASMAAASSAAGSTASSLEEQPTIVDPPPSLQRQASSSPFSAFQGAAPFDNDP